MKGSGIFTRAQTIIYYLLIVIVIYLVIIYAPILYQSITFKGYIKNTLSSPDRYPVYRMRELVLTEAERRGFLIDDIYIEPKGDEITAIVKWHVVVNHLGIFKHPIDFKADVTMKVANF